MATRPGCGRQQGVVVDRRWEAGDIACRAAYNYLADDCRQCCQPTTRLNRALRKSVIFRELSFGTEEKTGSQNLAVIMSVTETCRRVGRRPFDYIKDADKAAFNTKPAPKLIPQNRPRCERLPNASRGCLF
jgi:hypothetical protein